MKKVYDIKTRDLESILTLLKENIQDSMVLMDVVRLEEYIKRIRNGFKCTESISLIEQMQDDAEHFEFYKPFYPFVESFINTGMSVYDLDSNVRYHSSVMSDEQVMCDVVEFYSHQGSLFYSQILEYQKESTEHLKFVKDTLDTDGETLFLKSIGEAFVFSPNYSNITKFTILVHEVQHVIDFYINPNFSEEFVIRETIAMFMEMIAADYIANKYKLHGEGFKRQQYLHAIVKYQAHNIMYKMDALEVIFQNKNRSEEEIIALLEKEEFDREDLEFYFEQGITTDYSYQIAYLIAIELYVLYYKNKELVLKICEDIIVNGTSCNIFEILDKYGIQLNSNVINYENKIYKKR